MSGPITSIFVASVVVSMFTSCSASSVSEGGADVDASTATAVQSQLLAALEREDQHKWNELTTLNFLALEGGKALDRQALFDSIGAAHKSGTHFIWTVTDVKIQGSKNLFVMSYKNVGRVIKSDAVLQVVWFETAAFQRGGSSRWRAFLLTSELVEKTETQRLLTP